MARCLHVIGPPQFWHHGWEDDYEAKKHRFDNRSFPLFAGMTKQEKKSISPKSETSCTTYSKNSNQFLATINTCVEGMVDLTPFVIVQVLHLTQSC